MRHLRLLFKLAMTLSAVGAAHLALQANVPGMLVSLCVGVWAWLIWFKGEEL